MLVLVVAAATPTALGASVTARAKEPAQWDPRIEKLVRFVEKERGLLFDHPIPVVFLDDAEFIDEYDGDGKVTKRDREDAAHYAGELRALGLIEGDVDLIAAYADLDAADITGFYDDGDKRMVIRGTSLEDVEVRVTVVHELTHALQDQRFGFRKLDRNVSTSGEDFAITALTEGDATYVEDAYLFSLPRAERDAYLERIGSDEPDAALGDVPPVLDLISSAPYVFGYRFVAAIAARVGGYDAVDDAYDDPPRTEEDIIDVASFLSSEARRVRAPKLDDDDVRNRPPDEFGALSLYLMLASRLDPKIALRAAEGWGGDRYVAFTRGDQECVRAAFVGDSKRDTTEIGDALDAWADSMPAGAATVEREKSPVTLTACESEATRAPAQDTLDAAVDLLTLRNDLLVEFVPGQVSPTTARCMADKAAVDPTLARLFYAENVTRSERDLIRHQVTRIAQTCSG